MGIKEREESQRPDSTTRFAGTGKGLVCSSIACLRLGSASSFD